MCKVNWCENVFGQIFFFEEKMRKRNPSLNFKIFLMFKYMFICLIINKDKEIGRI